MADRDEFGAAEPESDSGSDEEAGGWTRRSFLSEAVRRGGVIGLGVPLAASERGNPNGSSISLEDSHQVGAPDRVAHIRRRTRLGRTGIEIPDISFGSFALEDDENLVRHALDRGITHFDTAESYTDGRAEEVLGRALRDRRHEVTITSKFWAKPEHTAEEQMAVLERSLRRLQTDYIDIYLNHAVNDVARLDSDSWQTFVERAKRDGKIRSAGMSGHAGHLGECLRYALDHELVDIILVAYNFSQEPGFGESLTRYLRRLAASFDLVTTNPDLPGLLARAHAEDVGVMVMKTLKGARKNDMRPYEAPGGTFAQAAFRWVLSNPSIDGLVVTMTDPGMIDEYVAASGSGPPDAADLALLARYVARNAGRSCQIGCGDCQDACPVGVPIADLMRVRMYDRDYGLDRVAQREYASLPINAAACLECSGLPCESVCPNGLVISELNRDTHAGLMGTRSG